MKTDLIIDLLAKEGKHIEENWVKDIPMGRLAHPSELKGTIVWMASDASSYLTGSDIVSEYLRYSAEYDRTRSADHDIGCGWWVLLLVKSTAVVLASIQSVSRTLEKSRPLSHNLINAKSYQINLASHLRLHATILISNSSLPTRHTEDRFQPRYLALCTTIRDIPSVG